jgi:hypothetical protein
MPCLTDFIFKFIRRPIPPILSPSSRTFVELTLVNDQDDNHDHDGAARLENEEDGNKDDEEDAAHDDEKEEVEHVEDEDMSTR